MEAFSSTAGLGVGVGVVLPEELPPEEDPLPEELPPVVFTGSFQVSPINPAALLTGFSLTFFDSSDLICAAVAAVRVMGLDHFPFFLPFTPRTAKVQVSPAFAL